MKLFFILIVIMLMLSCSRNREMKPETREADPQYLEVMFGDRDRDENTLLELSQLHQIRQQTYRINSGDSFNFYVYDESELNTEGVMVKPDGAISLKLIGEVQVEGLTVAEATSLIEQKFEKYLRYPKVSLIPSELTGSRVTVMGKVNLPGIYKIESDMRVADAIAVARGLSSGIFQNNTVELADLERSYLVRNNRILPVDFRALIREGNMLHNIPLINGDYIYIPSSVNREIYVLGEVETPWHFLFKESMTLMQVITFARGLKPTAQPEVIVIRGGLSHPRVFKVNIRKILNGEAPDFPLEPNDIVFAPKSALAKWNDILNMLLPSLEAVQAGWMIDSIMRGR